MKLIELLFIGKPLNISFVGVIFLIGYLLLRFFSPESTNRSWSLIAAICGWFMYAGWEWFVQLKTPEANIRVDLLITLPILGVLTVWALVRSALTFIKKG